MCNFVYQLLVKLDVTAVPSISSVGVPTPPDLSPAMNIDVELRAAAGQRTKASSQPASFHFQTKFSRARTARARVMARLLVHPCCVSACDPCGRHVIGGRVDRVAALMARLRSSSIECNGVVMKGRAKDHVAVGCDSLDYQFESLYGFGDAG